MLTIVVPMAGRGSRFASAGFTLPKPLIPVHGQAMINVVIANLTPQRRHRFVFLVLAEHLAAHGLAAHLEQLAPGCVVVPVDQVTEGAACTVLLAREHIDAGPLMIANTDQWVDVDIEDYLAAGDGLDGLIMTMSATDPKWSYAQYDENRIVTRVVEKEVVSDEATVGIYNFASGTEFVAGAESMIAQDLRVNGEFYVAPVYNSLIEQGARIGLYNIGAVGDGMYGLGIPPDLEDFIALPVSHRAADAVVALREVAR